MTIIIQLQMLRQEHFNSHAHVERDCEMGNMADAAKDFNSHAHVERDRKHLGKIELVMHFNSHAHVERDCY